MTTVSTTLPLAEASGWHPVHRATAELRDALLGSTAAAPDPAEIWKGRPYCLDPDPAAVDRGPVGVTDLRSLEVRIGGDLAVDDLPPCQPPVMERPDGAAADALEDAPEGEAMLDYAAQAQLDGLVQAFYRRQRQASLVVACSISAAVALTLAVIILLFFSVSGPEAPGSAPNRAAKSASLSVDKAGGEATDRFIEAPQVIRATLKQPLALAPLLPLGPAQYLLLQGLPETAALSAGRRTGPGAWMVKASDLTDLTLTLSEASDGDYPVDVYLLDAGSAPQARRRLVLRVAQPPQLYTAGFNVGWVSSHFARTAAKPTRAPVQSADAGDDIAAMRRNLAARAEAGEANAAYELALTFDAEVLAKAGVADVAGNDQAARAWYARAAALGHADAKMRLRSLGAARPRAGA